MATDRWQRLQLAALRLREIQIEAAAIDRRSPSSIVVRSSAARGHRLHAKGQPMRSRGRPSCTDSLAVPDPLRCR